MPRPLRLLLLALLLLAAAPAGASAAGTCDVWGAPSGSDAAAGTQDAPLRTAQRVVSSLQPGETGCLRQGTYDDEVTGPYVAQFPRSGRAGAPITLRSAPGERATLRGIVTVADGRDHVVLADLDIDGRRRSGPLSTSVQVQGDHVTLSGNTITNHGTAVCVNLGYPGWGEADHTTITGNTFTDCGDTSERMQHHAIYAGYASGTLIRDNLFVRTAGYAVHLYPDAHRTVVDHNTMVDNGGGVIFAGEGDTASTGNLVEHNVITGTTTRPAIESWWGGRIGTRNTARDNCVSGNAGNVDRAGRGFRAIGNLTSAFGLRADLTVVGGRCLSRIGYDPVRRLIRRGPAGFAARLAGLRP